MTSHDISTDDDDDNDSKDDNQLNSPMRPAFSPVVLNKARGALAQPLRTRFLSILSARPAITARATSSTTRQTGPSTTHAIKQKATMSSSSIPDRYKLIFYVPHSHLNQCKEATFAAGAGVFDGGKYTKACFQMPGTGQFLPGAGANPAIGAVGEVEYVEEMKVEVMCVGRSIMLDAVKELVKAHPYEEVAYEVYKMENV